jgi:hypothetical protein
MLPRRWLRRLSQPPLQPPPRTAAPSLTCWRSEATSPCWRGPPKLWACLTSCKASSFAQRSAAPGAAPPSARRCPGRCSPLLWLLLRLLPRPTPPPPPAISADPRVHVTFFAPDNCAFESLLAALNVTAEELLAENVSCGAEAAAGSLPRSSSAAAPALPGRCPHLKAAEAASARPPGSSPKLLPAAHFCSGRQRRHAAPLPPTQPRPDQLAPWPWPPAGDAGRCAVLPHRALPGRQGRRLAGWPEPAHPAEEREFGGEGQPGEGAGRPHFGFCIGPMPTRPLRQNKQPGSSTGSPRACGCV